VTAEADTPRRRPVPARGGGPAGPGDRARRTARLLGRVAAACALVLSSASASVPGTAARAEPAPVEWRIPDVFPWHVGSGPRAGDGVIDRTVAAIASRIPDRDHRVRGEPLSRILGTARRGEAICTAGVLRTPERERHLVFTQAERPALGNRLVLRAPLARAHGLEPGSEVPAAVVARLVSSATIAVLLDRSFGPGIDAAVAAGGGGTVRMHDMEQLIRLADAGRFDGFFAYAVEIRPDAFLPGGPLGDFRSFAVDGASAGRTPLAACTRAGEGQALVARIDAAAAEDPSLLAAAAEAYASWLDPDSRGLYARLSAEMGIDVPDAAGR